MRVGEQPQDSAFQMRQQQRGGEASGGTGDAGQRSAAAAAVGAAELVAPDTPGAGLLRDAGRRSSRALSGSASAAAAELERWEVDFKALTLIRPLGEGSAGRVSTPRSCRTEQR